METFLSICFLLSFFLIFLRFSLQSTREKTKLPPSPRSIPIIGHLHLLKNPLPLTLQKLAIKYGPIIFLSFGWRHVLLVSTPEAAEECFTKNDIIFSNRPKMASRKSLEYNYTSIGTAPYGHHWRNLRRFTTLKIFSSTRVLMSSSIRTDEVRYLTKILFLKGNQIVDVKSLLYMTSFNIVMKMISGQRYFEGEDFNLNKGNVKYDFIKNTFNPSIYFALGDFFPFLSFLGVTRKRNKLHQKRDKFMQDLIELHRENKLSSTFVTKIGKIEPIIDVMLSLQQSEPETYSDTAIKGTLQAMLIAGTETSVTTMEAVVSFLIAHPKILQKARDEIDANTKHSILLEDEDLGKLNYLQCIINETLRLGPTVPLIPPRESSQECIVGGYHVPRGTMLWVNARALHTDPILWDEPLEFIPERFKGTEGQKGDFKFIPFGMGRRQCPGTTLAMRLMVLTLGTLIQCFDWEKVERDVLKVKFSPRETFAAVFSEGDC